MRYKTILSVMLAVVLILCSCTFSVSAVDFNSNTLDIDYSTITQTNASTSSISITDYSSTSVLEPVFANSWGMRKDGYRIYNTNPYFYSLGYNKTTLVKNNFSVKRNHNYSVDFDVGISMNFSYTLQCYIDVRDGSGNGVKNIMLYEWSGVSYPNPRYVTFDFNLSNSDLPDGYILNFVVDISTSSASDHPYSVVITDISYVDNDDNSQLLDSIVLAIGVLWNAVNDFNDDVNAGFNAVISNIQIYGNSILNKLTIINNDLNTNFANLSTSLSADFNSLISVINTNFTNLNLNLNTYFTNLNNNINDNFSLFTDNWNLGITAIRDDLRDYFTGDEYVNDTSQVDELNDEFVQAEASLPSINDSGIDDIFSSPNASVANFHWAFVAVNSIFDSLVSAFDISTVITFSLCIGLCVYLLGRRLSSP